MVGVWLGLGAWSLAPAPACAVQEQDSDEECYDFSEYLPDNVSIDGCWECDTDVHWFASLFSWSWKATLNCVSGDDAMTIELD